MPLSCFLREVCSKSEACDVAPTKRAMRKNTEDHCITISRSTWMSKCAVRARYLQHKGFAGLPDLLRRTDTCMFIPRGLSLRFQCHAEVFEEVKFASGSMTRRASVKSVIREAMV